MHSSVLQSQRSSELGVPGRVRVWIPCVQARGVALRRWRCSSNVPCRSARQQDSTHCVCVRCLFVCLPCAAAIRQKVFAVQQQLVGPKPCMPSGSTGAGVVQRGRCWDPRGVQTLEVVGCWCQLLQVCLGGRMCYRAAFCAVCLMIGVHLQGLLLSAVCDQCVTRFILYVWGSHSCGHFQGRQPPLLG